MSGKSVKTCLGNVPAGCCMTGRFASRALGQAGFTLMEVLVATAITGIALGVLLSGFAQGHRQAFRGDMARRAAGAADVVLNRFKESRDGFPEEDSGDIKGFEGWTFRLESAPLMLDIREVAAGEDARQGRDETEGDDASKEKGFEVPGLREVYLYIIPPDGARPFVLTTWVDSRGQ